MSKILSAILVCAAALTMLTGCKHNYITDKSRKETVSEGSDPIYQHSDSYEDAIKECFNATYSENGGKIFFAYMYPDSALKAAKEAGTYDDLINKFNTNQKEVLSRNNDVFTFGEIKEADEIDSDQIAAAKTYLAALSTDLTDTVTEDDLDISTGYEVIYTYLKNGEKDGEDLVLVIQLNDEGWKVITGG